jgi:hypothetical protein
MQPIHELINRIRWDSEFAKGSFQLGYYDMTEDRVDPGSISGSELSTEKPANLRTYRC